MGATVHLQSGQRHFGVREANSLRPIERAANVCAAYHYGECRLRRYRVSLFYLIVLSAAFRFARTLVAMFLLRRPTFSGAASAAAGEEEAANYRRKRWRREAAASCSANSPIIQIINATSVRRPNAKLVLAAPSPQTGALADFVRPNGRAAPPTNSAAAGELSAQLTRRKYMLARKRPAQSRTNR